MVRFIAIMALLAQEVFSRFGHDGIMMIAIQAIEKRTQELSDVKQQLTETQKEVAALKATQQGIEVLKVQMRELQSAVKETELYKDQNAKAGVPAGKPAGETDDVGRK